jgi:hypothetical protein
MHLFRHKYKFFWAALFFHKKEWAASRLHPVKTRCSIPQMATRLAVAAPDPTLATPVVVPVVRLVPVVVMRPRVIGRSMGKAMRRMYSSGTDLGY